jgi:4-hydroxybenzoate polyprenyltransferase
MSFTFAINNYYDIESDIKNPRRIKVNAIASGKISKKISLSLIIMFAIIPLIISILYKLEIFFFCAFLLFEGWAYSAFPLRIKSRPVLDILWHILGFFSYVMWGSFIAGSITLLNWLMAISLGVWSSVAQIGNHICDYSFDKDSGTMTFAVWVGLDKARITMNFLTFIHLIILIPLVLSYSLKYWVTISLVIIIPILGFIILKPEKGAIPIKSFTYYFTVVIGGAVYLSCIVYKIMLVIGAPPIDFYTLLSIA